MQYFTVFPPEFAWNFGILMSLPEPVCQKLQFDISHAIFRFFRFFPFSVISSHSGHGNPDSRFRIGWKLRKTEKTGKVKKLHVTCQIKAYCTLVHAGTLKFQQNSEKTVKLSCIYIILLKAMRPIGRSPASCTTMCFASGA